MKYFVVFCIVLLAVVAYVAATDEKKEEYCSEAIKKSMEGKCLGLKCNKDSTSWTQVGCGLAACPGEIERVEKEDPSKPFPECCEKMICKK